MPEKPAETIEEYLARLIQGYKSAEPVLSIIKKEKIDSTSETIGFVFPLYFSGLPFLVNEFIKKIKKGALLINTARGALIETDALLKALQKGGLGGAGLDVLEEECYVREDKEVMSRHFPKECDLRIILENHALAKMGNVIITPHNAFNSVEALQRILDMTIENIKFFLKKKIVNEVN